MKQTLKQRWNKLLDDLRPMTWKQKIDHLWTYYYWVLIIVAVIVTLCCIVYSSVTNLNRQVLLSGVLVNADVSLEGRDFISDRYFEKLGGIKGDQEIQISDVYFQDPNTTTDIDQTYTATMRVVAMVSTKSVDYLLMDQIGMEFYLGQDLFLDLNELFSREELDKWKDDLIYLTYEETGETIPVAINVRNTRFAEEYLLTEKDHYIGFVANTPRPDACKVFWAYLKAGE